MRLQLTHSLHRLVRQRPSDLATLFQGRRRSWQELADRSARLATVLRTLGLEPGGRIGMLANNRDSYFEYLIGTWWAGGAVNPVNIRWSTAEIAFSLDDCDTRVLLVDEHFASLGPALRAASRSLRTLVYVGAGATPDGMLDGGALLAGAAPAKDAGSGGDDLAGVFYTGGTTGFPKGVMLTHHGLLSNALGCLLEANLADDDVVLSVAPMFHLAGLCMINRALVRGRPTIIVPGFDPLAVLEAIQSERVTFTLLVPTMIQRLLDHPGFARFDLSSLRHIIYGASPISEGLLERTLKAIPGVALTQQYGMTETGGPYTILPPSCHRLDANRHRLRSAGRAAWSMDVRIADLDGRTMPNGEVGEIVARGAGVMKGYWNRPCENEDAFRDGWLRSGDMGYMDDEGFVYLVDRLKDMIVSGGENVYSAEVENALGTHPAVASCAVIGVPSEKWGEAVHAIVVLRADLHATAEDLRSHCKGLIAGYKCPVSVEFRDSMPLSGAGKLLKHVLREPYWQGRTRRVS
ncbi:MAG: long-chain fatty acid--CoA ligase [Alphaproteobacteria bacterium]|nr:long-chain fatty acid--CoA ligase [Alphaproteobacteria bacterium]MCW5742019.1 long-chain fatty acid--CoA ligase [Alphaproteobacteria bacterium]